MSWLTTLLPLITELRAVSSLLREQNALARERHLADHGRPSLVVGPTMPPSRNQPSHRYTDRDVDVVDRPMRVEQSLREQVAQAKESIRMERTAVREPLPAEVQGTSSPHTTPLPQPPLPYTPTVYRPPS